MKGVRKPFRFISTSTTAPGGHRHLISTAKGTITDTSVDSEHRKALLEAQIGREANLTDKNNYVFMIFMMFGFGALLPWNMFLNISFDYYTNFKLRQNDTATWYSTNFQNAMTISAQLPNLVFSVASIFLASKGDMTRRMRACLLIVQATVVLTILGIYIDTDDWIGTFFAITILTIFVLNAANGLFQNSMFGLASPFPFKYTNAIIIGQNFCGIAVTVLAMVCRAVNESVQPRAVLYFSISSVFIIACFVLLNLVKKLSFYRAYGEFSSNSEEATEENTTWNDINSAFSKSKAQFANIFFLFFVTLSLFPNITMYVRDNLEGEFYGFLVPEGYYKDVTTFLNFNLFAFLGSLAANWIQVPGPNTIWIAVVARFWFLFYFPMANYLPMDATRHFPVLFESTWLFVFHVTVLAFTSGYLSSLIMMYAPRSHEDPKIKRMAGMIAAFFLIAGIVAGLGFSWLVKIAATSPIENIDFV